MSAVITAAPETDPFGALNDEQREAVVHGDEPLLVIAGAGTGKTTTLAHRVASLVLAGAAPNRILLLTFSRRAAFEMARRAGSALHRALGLRGTQSAPALPWAGTFHSVAARLLRDWAPRVGLAEAFTILDRADAEAQMALAREALGLAAAKQRAPSAATCLAIYSRVVNAQETVEQVVGERYPYCLGWESELRELFRAYMLDKQQQQVLDYDDLLLYWLRLMEESAIATAIGARFSHVLVDEYQDTNKLQAAILAALKPDGRGVTVVGDDAQAIYGFRAAEVRNILDFPTRFAPPARVVTLARNYRSTQPVLDAGNAVIALAEERFDKRLWSDRPGERPRLVTVADEAAQADWVCDEVLRQREAGLMLRQQAVLFRTGHHSAALELELARRRIPFVKYGGLRFLEAAHVKDVLAVLRWVQNPRSRLAGFRVALLVPGIGPASARKLLDAVAAAPDPHEAFGTFKPPAAGAPGWRDWLAARDAIAAAPWPDAFALAARWYQPQLERLHDDAAVRAVDLAQLGRLAVTYPDRERFLAELTLDPPEATSDESDESTIDEDYLILSTMHSAKGQEWAAVTLLNMVDGCMPADLAVDNKVELEEERRLLHVAMTRAKRHLALVVPQRFYVTQQRRFGDRHLYAGLTRFIPPEVAALFDVVQPAARADGAAAVSDTPPPGSAAPPIDLLARVRDRF